MCLFIVSETKFTIGESRTISHEHFPPKLLWNENADFKFSANNEGEDVNKKLRSRENIAQHSEGNARQQETEEQEIGIRGIMIVLQCGKRRLLSLPVSPPIYRSTSAKLQFSITAPSVIIFRRTALPYLSFVFAFFLIGTPK